MSPVVGICVLLAFFPHRKVCLPALSPLRARPQGHYLSVELRVSPQTPDEFTYLSPDSGQLRMCELVGSDLAYPTAGLGTGARERAKQEECAEGSGQSVPSPRS